MLPSRLPRRCGNGAPHAHLEATPHPLRSPSVGFGGRIQRISATIDVMVVLVVLGLSLAILLIVTMVAMTRYLLANPDDPLVPGDGSWSGSLGEPAPAPRQAAVQAPQAEPVPVGPSARAVPGAHVPLDDMPAEVIAEIAHRLRRDV